MRSLRGSGRNCTAKVGCDFSDLAVFPLSAVAEPYQMDRVIFTHNNYIEADMEKLRKLAQEEDSPLSYLIYGEEVAPETGTPHLQGFLILKKKKVRSAIQKLLTFERVDGSSVKAWFENAKSDSTKCVAYCKKDGKFWEMGTYKRSRGEAGAASERSRWEGVYEAIDNCNTEAEFMEWLEDNLTERDFMAKLEVYLRTFNLRNRKTKKPKIMDPTDLVCEWFMGPPGTGKSRAAREENPEAYTKMTTGRWWDDYDGEMCVIIEDLDMGSRKHFDDIIKQLADIYPVRVEVKGSSKFIRPKKIIVTSNYAISTLWSDPAMVAALNRRFKVRKFAPAAPANPGTDGTDAHTTVIDLTQAEAEDGAEQANPAAAVFCPFRAGFA